MTSGKKKKTKRKKTRRPRKTRKGNSKKITVLKDTTPKAMKELRHIRI